MINHFVVMGVSGCGKSTVANRLATHFNGSSIEADELHGADNIKKMSRGLALDDADRIPWLARVAETIQATDLQAMPVFVSCSALRRRYRQCLLDTSQVPIAFIHLYADRDIIEQRMSEREGHFMPVSLLHSQYDTLEHLEVDEQGALIDISLSLECVFDKAVSIVRDLR